MSFKLRMYLMPLLGALYLFTLMVVVMVRGATDREMLLMLEKGHVPAAEGSRESEILLTNVQRALLDAVAAEDAESLSRVDELKASLLKLVAAARTNPAIEPAQLQAFERELTTYIDSSRTIAARMIAKDPKVRPEVEAMTQRYQLLKTQLSQASEAEHARVGEAFDELRSHQRTTQIIVFVVAVFCIVFLVGSAVRLGWRVLGPVARLTQAATAVAEGDLSFDLPLEGDDELAKMAGAFTSMIARLREVNRSIKLMAQQLSSAAAQINAAAREQEAASQTQSSSVEEVNRTMQSLLESATHIATSAAGVSTNAERTKETALTTSKKIAELSAQANRMSEILEVIREIADRSDLLALNASLEGTRAGEAGRGFSLVASEMRRLSERVASSVRDVKTLVNDIRASGASTVMVTEEARTLADSTAASAAQITLVTQQQRTSTEMVSTSMKGVASVLVETVSATAQTKAAAGELARRAEELGKLVAHFKLGPAA